MNDYVPDTLQKFADELRAKNRKKRLAAALVEVEHELAFAGDVGISKGPNGTIIDGRVADHIDDLAGVIPDSCVGDHDRCPEQSVNKSKLSGQFFKFVFKFGNSVRQFFVGQRVSPSSKPSDPRKPSTDRS